MKKKSTKTIPEKKTIRGNTVTIHNVLKKNKKTKFSTNSILKKIKLKKNNSEKKTQKMKKKGKFWQKKI
jgi:hypothetical protein